MCFLGVEIFKCFTTWTLLPFNLCFFWIRLKFFMWFPLELKFEIHWEVQMGGFNWWFQRLFEKCSCVQYANGQTLFNQLQLIYTLHIPTKILTFTHLSKIDTCQCSVSSSIKKRNFGCKKGLCLNRGEFVVLNQREISFHNTWKKMKIVENCRIYRIGVAQPGKCFGFLFIMILTDIFQNMKSIKPWLKSKFMYAEV